MPSDRGSFAVAAFLSRNPAGEVTAAVGIDVQTVPQAVLPEGVRYQVRSDRHLALPAELAFPMFGLTLPVGVSGRQEVAVFHHGLDLAVVLDRVPGHA